MRHNRLQQLYTTPGAFNYVKEDVMETMSMEEWLDIESENMVDDVVEGYFLEHYDRYDTLLMLVGVGE